MDFVSRTPTVPSGRRRPARRRPRHPPSPGRHAWIERAPLVAACLRSLFPTVKALLRSRNQMSASEAELQVLQRCVLRLAVPLFTRNIWTDNFLQAELGATLRLQGCSGPTLDTLNGLGLCQNKGTVRMRLNRLRVSRRRTNGEATRCDQIGAVQEEEDEEQGEPVVQ
ncbi:uncharacterized protein LOC144075186 [Stigmatopora argus]